MEISVLPTNEFDDKLRSIIRSELKEALLSAKHDSLNGSEEIIKRTDIAKMFGVSLVTVHEWMSKGILPHYKMNGRTYFKKNEVLQAMKQVKIRRK